MTEPATRTGPAAPSAPAGIDLPSRSLFSRLLERLYAPVDIASLAALRILFGLMMFGGTVRFMLSGWIEKQYVEPSFFFKYSGFSWVTVWPSWGLYLHFGALAILALCIATGFFFRASMALFLLGFGYVQLMDVTNYLNHYYFIVLMCGLMCLLPMHGAWSIDALRRPALRRETTPAWTLWLLRFQVAALYTHAGLAKVGSDWLMHAQPMNLWMSARNETPIIGPLLDELWVAYAMSWAGFLYDATIVLFLLARRTRPLAYLTVLTFHGLTHLFFNIGMFPMIMVVVTTVFFAPEWPRALAHRLLRRREAHTTLEQSSPAVLPTSASLTGTITSPRHTARLTAGRRAALAAFAVYAAFQVLFPFRHVLYPGDVIWNEEGMRFAWKVMLREKSGSLTYHVRAPSGREWQVSPSRYLTRRQVQEMAVQPDLILQLARHIAADFRKRGLGDVEVRAEARVSLNGRKAALLIDPRVDLARVEEGFAPAAWILPMPGEPPLQLSPAGPGRNPALSALRRAL